MIPGYPKGSNLLLLNTMYIKPAYGDDGKFGNDFIVLTIKDLNTGAKFHHTIEKPDYEFYIAKDDVQIDHNLLFIEKEKVKIHSVPYMDLLKEVAGLSNNEEFFYDNLKSGNRYANNQLFMYNRIFNADMDIEDNYRFRFARQYGTPMYTPTMAYFDIEADTIDMRGDFPELGECPVNAITIIDNETGQVYTLLLRDNKNPLIKEFEDGISSEAGFNLFEEALKAKLLDATGNIKNYKRLGFENLNFGVKFYDEEIQLIQDLFEIINSIKPDFVLAWNMAFDIPYLIERIKVLGYDPAVIMSHPDFSVKRAYYFIDERVRNEFAERGDFARISSYSVYLDQLIHFASRRKGQSKIKSHKLDYIGQLTAGIKKLDYSHITRDIAKLPYKDYLTFVIYNIIDTLVQKAVEHKTGDINYIFNKALMNNTRYHKAHRQTVYLTNRVIKEFYDAGMVIGNNINKFKSKPEVKFPGALVGDPTNMEQDALMTVDGIPLRVAENADDFDFTALYPSEMDENNIAPNTEIGKIEIQGNPNPDFNPFNNERFADESGYFIEDYISGNMIEFCKRWFGMPDILEVIESVQKYFDENQPVHDHNYFNPLTGMFKPFRISNTGLRKPVYFDENRKKPFNIYREMPEVRDGIN